MDSTVANFATVQKRADMKQLVILSITSLTLLFQPVPALNSTWSISSSSEKTANNFFDGG